MLMECYNISKINLLDELKILLLTKYKSKSNLSAVDFEHLNYVNAVIIRYLIVRDYICNIVVEMYQIIHHFKVKNVSDFE